MYANPVPTGDAVAFVVGMRMRGTARMGHDALAVVDSRLRVGGFEGLRVADASVLPRVTVANTMAPSVLVGERAAAILREGR